MSYDLSKHKAEDLKEKLRSDIEKIMGETPNDKISRFR